MKIKKIPFEKVREANFKPEPHTVILNKDKPESEWWALLDDEENMLCVLCIVCRKYEVHFARTYTPPRYRRKGYCTTMLQYMSSRIYPNDKLTAHCLSQSVNCYSKAGFKLKCVKVFKHGPMYYMEREGR